MQFSNSFTLQGGILTTSTSYIFPIAFSIQIIGMGCMQTGDASATINRYAFKSRNTTGFTVSLAKDNMHANGAYYIAIGY